MDTKGLGSFKEVAYSEKVGYLKICSQKEAIYLMKQRQLAEDSRVSSYPEAIYMLD